MSAYGPPSFSYTPLPRGGQSGALRLLILAPGSGSAPLRCQLVQAESTAKYEALSYNWGSTIKPCRIEVSKPGGLLSKSPRTSPPTIDITASLDMALRHLRYHDRPRTLWIDAVCINQADVEEREAQVLRMKEIFGNATQTIVWLGEEDPKTAEALQCIDTLKSVYARTYNKQALRADLEAIKSRPWLLDRSHRGYISGSAWQAFKELLLRPWFSRVWVFQEVTVSPRTVIACGNKTLLWRELSDACEAIETFNLDVGYREHQPLHTSVLIMEEARASHARPLLTIPQGASAPRILDLTQPQRSTYEGMVYPRLDIMLLMLRWAQATDPRDKVYAVLGITSGFSRDLLKPNYTLSVRDAYMQTVRALTQMSGLSPLAFLSFVQHAEKHSSTDLPSWVPDWRQELHAPWLIYNSGFRTATSVPASISFKAPDMLSVKGVSLMRIAILGAQAGSKRSLPPPDLLSQLPNPYGGTYEEVYAEGLDPETNFFGKGTPSARNGCRMPFWEWKRTHQDATSKLDAPGNLGTDDSPISDFAFAGYEGRIEDPDITAWDRLERINGITHGRKLFVSDQGFMGLAPLTSRVGDEICALFGGKVPFVVRREDEEGTKKYRFVGECYVFGLMNGEVLDGLDDNKREEFVFH